MTKHDECVVDYPKNLLYQKSTENILFLLAFCNFFLQKDKNQAITHTIMLFTCLESQ